MFTHPHYFTVWRRFLPVRRLFHFHLRDRVFSLSSRGKYYGGLKASIHSVKSHISLHHTLGWRRRIYLFVIIYDVGAFIYIVCRRGKIYSSIKNYFDVSIVLMHYSSIVMYSMEVLYAWTILQRTFQVQILPLVVRHLT